MRESPEGGAGRAAWSIRIKHLAVLAWALPLSWWTLKAAPAD